MFTESTAIGALPLYSAKRNLHHAVFFCDAPQAKQVSLNPSRVAIPLDKVQKRAYAIFEARAGAPGHELDDWLLAEAEILTRSLLSPARSSI